jgi:hypothetical protein
MGDDRVVSRSHGGLTLRAEQQSHATAGRPGRIALTSVYLRLLTPAFCDLVVQRLADAEPGNTTYARDLSISFERLADLAHAARESDQAQIWASKALAMRRELVRNEPRRLDLAEELAYVLYLSMVVGADPTAAPGEAVNLLQPFARLGEVTPRAQALLDWAYRTR